MVTRPIPPSPVATYSLEELYRDEFHDGWRVLYPSDLPGPYVRRLPGRFHHHSDGGEFVVRLRDQAGAVVWEERTRPGVSYHTLELETADGQRAHGPLVRSD